jgi:hypothetical protein
LDCGDASPPCRAIALAEAGSPDATCPVAQGADMSAHSKILTGVLDHHQAGAVEVTREEIAGYVRHPEYADWIQSVAGERYVPNLLTESRKPY